MVQIRIMHSDADRVRQVAELLLPLLRASGVLNVGDEVELPNRRDAGLRIVVDVTPADNYRVSAERVPPAPRSAASPRSIALHRNETDPNETGSRE